MTRDLVRRTEPGAADTPALPRIRRSAGTLDRLQRRIGLELEFPIPVDPLGVLGPEQEKILQRPAGEQGRSALHQQAVLGKDTTIRRGDGFVVRPDHDTLHLGPLLRATPAYAVANNVLEYIFDPPVEAFFEVREVLHSIYSDIDRVEAATGGLTRRAQFIDDYFVGPINTGGRKPNALGPNAYSVQVNIGVEPSRIPDLFTAYAQSTEMSDEYAGELGRLMGGDFTRIFSGYRDCLVRAPLIAAQIESEFRQEQHAESPLLGLRGLLAVEALYLLLGALPPEARGSGTVKNFTPLLLKTSLSWLTDFGALTTLERTLYKAHDRDLLGRVLALTRGEGASLNELLVSGSAGEKAGAEVVDLLKTKLEGPFIVAGQGIAPDPVGPTRGKEDPRVLAKDRIPYPEYLDELQPASVDDIEKYGERVAELLRAPREPTASERAKEERDAPRRNRRRGGVFETRMSSGDFDEAGATSWAREMYERVAVLHLLPDEEMMTTEGQTETTKEELGLE